jgi:predicted PurR-regulated permease PerM
VNPHRGSAREWPPAPPWSQGTRLWVLTMVVLLLAALWWNVRQFTIIVASAVLLAYLLNPVIELVRRRLRLSRGVAALAVYGAIVAAFAMIPVAFGPGLARSLVSTDVTGQWDRAVNNVFAALPTSVHLLGRTHDLERVYVDLRRELAAGEAAVAGRASLVWLLGFASDFAFTVFGVFFTFVASIYIAMDGERFTLWLERKVTPAYRPAYTALVAETASVWRAFFRGQIALCMVVAVLTWLGLLVLGVPYALPLALLAGVLEVVPRVGPTLSVLPAAAVALVQPSSTLPQLPTAWFVVLVIGMYVLVQQIENNVLVPRILGPSVNLPPVVVLVGALAGAALAGVPGILLAAPVIGSARVAGSWLWHMVALDDGAAPEAQPRDRVAASPRGRPADGPNAPPPDGGDGA